MNAPENGDALILGAQLAAAQAAETRHQAARPEPKDPSPLAGISYDLPPGRTRPTPLPAGPSDELIDEFADRFTSGSDDQRARLRSALTMDDLYTVLRYARRAAVRALRAGDEDDQSGGQRGHGGHGGQQIAARAVNALAAIDTDRVDARDLIWQACLLAYAVRRTGGDVVAVFEAAAARADSQTALATSARSADDRQASCVSGASGRSRPPAASGWPRTTAAGTRPATTSSTSPNASRPRSPPTEPGSSASRPSAPSRSRSGCAWTGTRSPTPSLTRLARRSRAACWCGAAWRARARSCRLST